MYKLIVLTDPDNADGFRLAGVDVVEATDPETARKRLAELVDDDDSGIIGINESYMAAIDERLRNKIDSIYRPIVIPLPIRETLHIDSFAVYKVEAIAEALAEAAARGVSAAIYLETPAASEGRVAFDITLRRG